MAEYSKEAMQALAEYITAFDRCVNAPDENYGAVFIETEPAREWFNQFFTSQEHEAILANLDEIRKILTDAGVSFE